MKNYNKKEELLKTLYNYKLSRVSGVNEMKYVLEMVIACFLRNKISKNEFTKMMEQVFAGYNDKTLKFFDINKIYLSKKTNNRSYYYIEDNLVISMNHNHFMNEKDIEIIENMFNELIKETKPINYIKFISIVFLFGVLFLFGLYFLVKKRKK